jgi:hypothetical protein
MLHLTLRRERSFMRTRESLSGSNSGKLLPSLSLVCHQDSICSKSIREMVHLLFNGWLITGIGSISQGNSRMVLDGTLKVTGIVMIMTT